MYCVYTVHNVYCVYAAKYNATREPRALQGRLNGPMRFRLPAICTASFISLLCLSWMRLHSIPWRWVISHIFSKMHVYHRLDRFLFFFTLHFHHFSIIVALLFNCVIHYKKLITLTLLVLKYIQYIFNYLLHAVGVVPCCAMTPPRGLTAREMRCSRLFGMFLRNTITFHFHSMFTIAAESWYLS